MEFINNDGSITDERKSTDDQTTKSHQVNKQSEARHVQKLQTSDNERNNRSSLLPAQCSVRLLNTNSCHPNYYYKNEEMDIKTVVNIQWGDPSEETLALTKRWREITNRETTDIRRDYGSNTNPQKR